MELINKKSKSYHSFKKVIAASTIQPKTEKQQTV